MVAARRAALAALLVASAACVMPYQPLPLRLPAALGADAFARCADVLRGAFGNLAVADPAGFRLQSRWVAYQEGELAARRRAIVYRGDVDLLCVVVERQVLDATLLGVPEWLPSRGDPVAEQRLADALRAALR